VLSRQVLAFGATGQKRIAAVHAGIIGLGGIGSQVAQALGYLGVVRFTLVDDDRVDLTNLNRLIGATPADADRQALKVDVAAQLLRAINPAVETAALARNLRTREALEALRACDVLFGCVDHDGPRLVLTELAAAYRLILIDAATEIGKPEENPEGFGGRVVVARPGDYCLLCANQIDQRVVKWELLSSSEERAFQAAHGYGLGAAAPAPGVVVSLNGVIANLAVTEFAMLATGLREPNRMVTYKGMRGIVTRTTDEHRPDCFVCSFLVGQRDSANVFRYGNTAPPVDIPIPR
jgi:molybdopterin/thiamine biosynthesis adenylyltransferase